MSLTYVSYFGFSFSFFIVSDVRLECSDSIDKTLVISLQYEWSFCICGFPFVPTSAN